MKVSVVRNPQPRFLMPAICPICKYEVCQPAVRPNLSGSDISYRTYYCRSCWLRMVASSSGAINCPCCRRPCSVSRSYVDASEYVPGASKIAESNRRSTDTAVRKAQKLRNYRRKKILQLRTKKNKKTAPKQG